MYIHTRNSSDRTPNFRVFLKPNNGRLTMEFKVPLAAESYYSAYDDMGRLLFQRPCAQGRTTEEIDLSRFCRGTYVIKFTDREGVCYERWRWSSLETCTGELWRRVARRRPCGREWDWTMASNRQYH